MKIVPLLFLTFFAVPTSAHYFYSYTLFYGEWAPARYVHFGGCEADANTGCLDEDNSDRGTFFNIGDLSVKQGVYSVETSIDDHGKLVFQYSYRYYTEESVDDLTDRGIIKVKDVATNELYYYHELHAEDATDEWVDVRVVLPRTAAGEKLQLVFEVENNDTDVSRMHVDAVGIDHRNPFAEVKGVVTQEVTGKDVAVEGATVTIKNRAKTKMYRTTTTDADGAFALYPLPSRARLTLVVESGDEVLTYNIRKLYRSSYIVDVVFPED